MNRLFAKIKIAIILGLTFAYTGCQSNATNLNTQTPSPPISNNTPTHYPTTTPVVTSTKTSTPPLPSETATQTASPTKTPTLTPLPSLDPLTAEEAIKALLQETNECQAPCIWGIVPGESSYGEARNLLTQLGLLMIFSTKQLGNTFYQFEYVFENGLSVDVILTTKADLIENLRLFIEPVQQQSGDEREWSAFSQETLISQYGSPSNIDFSINLIHEEDNENKAWYHMVMSFDSRDLIIEYNFAETQNLNSAYLICPLVDDFQGVRIWVGKDPVDPPLGGTGIVDAASMTIDEFAELLLISPQTACLNLNGAVFP